MPINDEMGLLANLIDSARDGREAAVGLLRDIIELASQSAPSADVVRIAEFLYDLRMEAARRHVETN